MINKKFIKFIFFYILICMYNNVLSMNVVHFYDTFLRPEKLLDSRFQLAAFFQKGFSTKLFDCDSEVKNVLRIWNKDQNALKMLEGSDPKSLIGKKRVRLDANDDGVRGHFCANGDLDLRAALEFYGWYYFRDYFSLGFYLPIYFMKLRNVSWIDRTKSVSADDFRVKKYLTNDFFNNVCELGGLHLGPWERTGVGDLTFVLEWLRDFEQARPFLKNVRLNGLLGMTLPTGKRRDENKIFALPFGSDGSMGVFLGAAIDLTFGKYFRSGLDINLLHTFGNLKCRRIKTHENQTDLLFLHKADAYKDFGLLQKINLYIQLFKVLGGASFKVGYQFLRHGDDILSIASPGFSDQIANTAESLQEWTTHSFICDLSYDFFRGEYECRHKVHPYISVFINLPFNGMRAATVKTIGISLSIDF